MNEEINIVSVYCDKKLKSVQKFKSLNQAHLYAEKQTINGYYCVLERCENGRCWAKITFRPKESI